MTTLHFGEETVPVGDRLPLLPLRDVVVFPHMVVPLVVGRPASVAALDLALQADGLLFVTAQREPDRTEPELEDLHALGVVARAVQHVTLPNGSRKVVLEGLVRARLEGRDAAGAAWIARLEVLEDAVPVSAEIEALQRRIATQFEEYVQLNRRIPDDVRRGVADLGHAAQLADTVAAHVIADVEAKQELVETTDVAARLRRLGRLLGRELEILRIEHRIETEIQHQVQRSQKEAYLNERLKAIRKELGHEDPGAGDVEDLAVAIESARMSQEAHDAAYKELERLSRMPSMSPEATVIRTWLETLTALPWRKRSRDRLDLARVKAQLDADHYGLDKVKDRILEYLAVLKLTRKLRGPILCLVGPPGVGKTSLGRSIATAMGRRFVRVSLGGVRDEAEIRGHRRTYIGAMPGRIVQSLRRCGTRNPVFLLDEIDKLGSDYRGDPSAALLEALDPEQNHAFSDHYLEVPFDLSRVLFITTANVLHTIPAALQDRLEILRLPGYLDHDKLAIARGHLLPKQLQEHGIDARRLRVTDAALEMLVRRYTREAGVRQLEREIGRLCRKVARHLAESGPVTRQKAARASRPRRAGAGASKPRAAGGTVRVDAGDVRRWLAAPPYESPEVPDVEEVGVATGLAWTAAGGEVLPIEVTRMRGTGQLILTGQLGDVMKESARAALTWVRSASRELGLTRHAFDKHDVHVHVPEGAIPKDGPSAGLAIATALVSLWTGRPVVRRVAMTGEITLRGKALAVGGLNEKCVAALRAGIHTVLVPQDNATHLEELPEPVRHGLRILPVSHMDAVLDEALAPRPRRARRTGRSRAASYAH